MTRLLFALLVILILTPSTSFAADSAPGSSLEYAAPTTPAPPDITGLVLRLVGLTAIMIALCAVVVWVARRNHRTAVAKGDGGRLRYEGMLPLDRRAVLHLIRVDGQSVAVTTDATGLRSMVLLTEPFEV